MTLQSGAEDARTMAKTMMYNGCETPFLIGTGATLARHGRFAPIARIGDTRIRLIASLYLVDGPGISVPNGRRLRS